MLGVRIHAISVVRDEVDVVVTTLRSAASWCSRIYVVDNCSIDGTWEKLQQLTRELPNLILLGRYSGKFNDALRAGIYHHVKRFDDGVDWWVRLDADEVYVIDPRSVLASVPRWHDAVLGSMYQYYPTEQDMTEHSGDSGNYAVGSLELRSYRNDWQELRFIRDSVARRWGRDIWPDGSLRIARQTIPIRHFQYRSPQQVAHRLSIRSTIDEFTHVHRQIETFEKLRESGWAAITKQSSELDFDDRIGPLIARVNLTPSRLESTRRQLGYWIRKIADKSISKRRAHRKDAAIGAQRQFEDQLSTNMEN